MMKNAMRKPNLMAKLKMLFACLFVVIPVLSLLTACDDDSPTKPAGNDSIPLVDSTAVERLLTVTFEDAYNRQDSVAYEAMLDERYEFENLPADPGDPLNVLTWNHADEMRITGRMFSGWTNANGVKVLDITIDITFLGDAVSTAVYEDQPEGETWHKAITEVDLLVVTQDPNSSDGSGIVNRVVYCNQDFIVRPDRDDPGSWVIRYQKDQPPITKTGFATYEAATAETTWGGVKGLFY